MIINAKTEKKTKTIFFVDFPSPEYKNKTHL